MSDPAVIGISPEQFEALLGRIGNQSATAMKQALKPEIDSPAPNSVFHPAGATKAPLLRPTFFCGVKQNWDQLTVGEVDDFNAITKNCTAREGRWKAVFTQNGTEQELHIWVPSKSIDERMDLPNPRRGSPLTGLQLICRELRESDDDDPPRP